MADSINIKDDERLGTLICIPIDLFSDILQEIVRFRRATERPMTSKQLAEFLSVSRAMLSSWTRAGKIPVHRLGSKRSRYYLSEVLPALGLKDAEQVSIPRTKLS
jgi:excisionase family DNA binding protein